MASPKAAASPVSRIIGPGTTKTSNTLFDRLGGEEKLDRIVTGVYNGMRADKEIGKQFARFNLTRLKDRTVDYLRGEFGGDPYQGSDLWISHSHLCVNNHWYDIMMKYYKQMLRKERIGKQETAEILESVEKMRVPIVDRDQRFKEMYLKYVEKQGGDGFGKSKYTEEEKVAKAQESKDAYEREMLAERDRARGMWSMDGPSEAASAPAKPPEPSRTSPVIPKAAAAPEAPKPKPKPKPKAPEVDFSKFLFKPREDSPPPMMPSSQPSASELFYRLSEYAPMPRAVSAP